MDSHFSIAYEIIDPVTRERFITEDRYIAEHHYNEKSCTVYERHWTITRLSPFTQTQSLTVLLWNDNPEFEETYNENDTNE